MQKWHDLADRMRATGKYYEPRTAGKLLARQYHRGDAVARFDETTEPWRVTAFVTRWKTRSLRWREVGSLYVENGGNGTGREILRELVENAPQVANLFLITSEQGVMKIAQECGFEAVTNAAFRGRRNPVIRGDVRDFALEVGLWTAEQDRLPESAKSWELPDLTKGGRWLFVR